MTATIAWRFTLAGIIGILATPLAVLAWAPLGLLGAASVLAIAIGAVLGLASSRTRGADWRSPVAYAALVLCLLLAMGGIGIALA